MSWVAAKFSTIVIYFPPPVVQALWFESIAVEIHIPIFHDTTTMKSLC